MVVSGKVNDSRYMPEMAVTHGRDAPPSHYLFKIKPFSNLSKSSFKTYISDIFYVEGFKWKFYIYLTGDKSKNVTNHISLYLELMGTSSLPTGWEVNFLDADGSVKRFHAIKTRWGITKFINLRTFSNPLNGYLVDDTSIFGAEVFVVKNTFPGECLSTMSDPPTCYHTWEIENFSTLQNDRYESETFGCYKWKILFCPKGCKEGKGNSISLFLDVTRSSIPANTKLLTKFILRVRDQRLRNFKNIEFSGKTMDIFELNTCIYTTSCDHALGFRKFMSLAKLKDPKQGYLVDDSFVIGAEVTLRE
ncbi:ubiquitin carboxyl-terminal hydrolase 12-like [Pistacia vera]|uniref:ubiquitin carboxyl-terminal hydrolase 12-like n=1 Tax=Pistacia vera TaxID=55513 RepID=UPI0012634F9C|nr:ubiquitin carboxyl-terminal hydrolase 12-like [Pistacia vera]